MIELAFKALSPALVEDARYAAAGAAAGSIEQPADDDLYPVRCCLTRVPGTDGVLLLSVRPPSCRSPYAAPGPVYVHKHACAGYEPTGGVPEMLRGSRLSLRGYDDRHMITGTAVVPADRLEGTARDMLADTATAYLFVHFAGPGCYACRIERAV